MSMKWKKELFPNWTAKMCNMTAQIIKWYWQNNVLQIQMKKHYFIL